MHHQLGVILSVHAVVGQIEGAHLPEQYTERVDIGCQVVWFATSDLGSHVTERTGVTRQLVKLGAAVAQRRVQLFGETKVENLDITC